MASTKELFQAGLGYLKLDIKEASETSNKAKQELETLQASMDSIMDDINALYDDIRYFKSVPGYDEVLNKTMLEINKLQQAQRRNQQEKARLEHVIKNEKATIKRAENLLEYFKNEYSYTNEDIEKAPIPTPEQLAADYARDLKDIDRDAETWTAEHSRILKLRAKELDTLRKKKQIPLDEKTKRPITGKALTAFLETKLTPLPC